MLLKNVQGETFEMSVWQDCGWRRLTCEKETCPICGRVKKQKQHCIDKGLDPDSWEAVMESVHESFKETAELLKKDAERLGIDLNNLEDMEMSEPPTPKAYPLHEKISKWHKEVFSFLGTASEWGESWINSEACLDLGWYANLLSTKTYRALSDKWKMNNNRDEVWVDYYYTRYVLAEILKILKTAFVVLRRKAGSQSVQLQILHSTLVNMEEEIKNI